ncbi:hypothetical protein RCL1_007487 [Eukaryota sp. TZLM3-RCL]
MTLISPLLINSDVVPIRKKTTSTNEFGAIHVFFPTVLSMFSVILFLRSGWVLAQAGLLQACTLTLLAGSVSFLTLLSISCIASNGRMKGGGAYYLISRTLGPEFGGAIGILFYLAVTFAVVLYTLALTDQILNNYSFLNFINSGDVEFDLKWTKFLISSGILILVLILCLIGAGAFLKSMNLFFYIFIATLLFFLYSLLVKSPDPDKGFLGWSWNTFLSNLGPKYSEIPDSTGNYYSYLSVFIINFPSFTGILSGVNMSGDLKDPSKAIPKGSISAWFFAVFVYIGMYFVFAFTTTAEARLSNYFIIQDLTMYPIVVAFASYAVLFASALSSLAGSARVLQALARDNLIPLLKPFRYGTKKGDEPYLALLVTWLLVQVAFLIGSVDYVAKLASMLFLLSYAFVNVACFMLRITGSPNFRPTFKYFHSSVGFIGGIACVVIMILSGFTYALLSISLMIVVFFVIHYKAPVSAFNDLNGDISQALLFHTVRKYLLRLDDQKIHVKYWRPQVLAVFRKPEELSSLNVAHFGNHLKKGGLYIVGQVIKGDEFEFEDYVRIRSELGVLIKNHGIKAFPAVNFGGNFQSSTYQLLNLSGLGQLKPNTIMLSFLESFDSHWNLGTEEFVATVKKVLDSRRNVLVTRNFEAMTAVLNRQKSKLTRAKRKRKLVIDVWPIHDFSIPRAQETVHLSLLLGHILSRSSIWKKSLLRVHHYADYTFKTVTFEQRRILLNNLLETTRISAQICIHDITQLKKSGSSTIEALNQVMKVQQQNSDVAFVSIEPPTRDVQSYYNELDILTRGIQPTVMVLSGGVDVVCNSL